MNLSLINMYRYLVFLLFPFFASAGSGTIIGVVNDEYGQPIPTANVTVPGTTLGTSTDFDGKFELKLSEGTYNLIISFIGFQTHSISKILVQNNKATSIGVVQLTTSTQMINTVTISASVKRNTESGLSTMQQKSISVMDGISSQSFHKTADGSAVVAVTRIPGVCAQDGKYIIVRGLGDRYTKTQLNGLDIPGLDPDKNTLQMDIFPTNILDNIIVLKTFTADLPSDFSGGIVNIQTNSEVDERFLNISTSLSIDPNMHFNNNYLTYKGSPTDFLGFDNDSRSIPLNNTDEKIDLPYITDDYEGTMKIINSFNKNLSAYKGFSLPNSSLSMSYGNQYIVGNNKWSVLSSFTYKNDSKLYRDKIQNFWQKSDDVTITELEKNKEQSGDVGINNIILGALLNTEFKTIQNSIYRFNILHLQNGEQKASIFFGENFESNQNQFKKENLEYNERSLSNILIEGNHNLIENRWKINWKISPTYCRNRDKDIRETPYEMEINNNDTTYKIDASNIGVPTRTWRYLDELNLATNTKSELKHILFGKEAKNVFGLSYTYKYRYYSILRYLTQSKSNGSPLTFSGNPDEILTTLLYDDSSQSGFYIIGNHQASNTYQGIQSNFSIYCSEEVDLTEKLKSIIGLRIEKYDQFYTGENQQGLVYNNKKVLSLFDFFPTWSLIQSVNDKTKLRFSVFRTTARPSFKEKSGAQILDILSGVTFNGNIDLSPTYINNYDIRIERFIEDGQLLSVSGFYKELINAIELVSYQSDPDNVQPRNIKYSQVSGLEFETKINLPYISNNISKYSANLNASLINSKVELYGEELESRKYNLRSGEELPKYRVMQGQSSYIINSGLQYSNINSTLDIGVFYNVQGEQLSIVSMNTFPDVYTIPFHSLNLNINKRIKNSKLSFGIKNLLNQKKEMVSRSFGSEDKIFSSWNQERLFFLSFSIKI